MECVQLKMTSIFWNIAIYWIYKREIYNFVNVFLSYRLGFTSAVMQIRPND